MKRRVQVKENGFIGRRDDGIPVTYALSMKRDKVKRTILALLARKPKLRRRVGGRHECEFRLLLRGRACLFAGGGRSGGGGGSRLASARGRPEFEPTQGRKGPEATKVRPE